MRKALNSNPLVQVGAIALLGVVVAFLMLTRLKGDEPVAEPTPAPGTAAVAGVSPTEPATPGPAAGVPADPAAAASADAPVSAGEFKAGPGLPEDIVRAYESGDSVVVLITRQGGIDDVKLKRIAEGLRGIGDVSLFHSFARQVADYSRITEGVELDRVPALIALSPRDVAGDRPPVATISYGFRGADSVRQAVRDAAYDGKSLPYHP